MAERNYVTNYDEYHKPGTRPHVRPCSLFGGRSPLTGKKVGERHRWEDGDGKGRCEFCGRYKDDVMSKLEKPDAVRS